MKISVFGKSGPNVVIFGLVCACSGADPLVAATAAASTTRNARKIPCMSVSLLGFILRQPITARVFFVTHRTANMLWKAINRSHSHVDAKCGLSRGSLRRPAETRGPCPHSRRRGLAGDRPHAGGACGPQGRDRTDGRKIRPR